MAVVVVVVVAFTTIRLHLGGCHSIVKILKTLDIEMGEQATSLPFLWILFRRRGGCRFQ